MTKPFKKERKGRIQGSVSSPHSMPLSLLSPEEQQRLNALVEQIRPMIVQQVQQDISFTIGDSINNGDIQQFIINYINYYINYYFQTIGHILTFIAPLKESGGTVTLELGTELGTTATGGGLEVGSAGLQVAPEDFLYMG